MTYEEKVRLIDAVETEFNDLTKNGLPNFLCKYSKHYLIEAFMSELRYLGTYDPHDMASTSITRNTLESELSKMIWIT